MDICLLNNSIFERVSNEPYNDNIAPEKGIIDYMIKMAFMVFIEFFIIAVSWISIYCCIIRRKFKFFREMIEGEKI